MVWENHHCGANSQDMNEPKRREQYLVTAQTNPQRLLAGATPRLIDEWQIAPELWDTIRFDVDHSDEDGKYILTGSAVPLDDEAKKKIHHSGTGRFAWIRMRLPRQERSGVRRGDASERRELWPHRSEDWRRNAHRRWQKEAESPRERDRYEEDAGTCVSNDSRRRRRLCV